MLLGKKQKSTFVFIAIGENYNHEGLFQYNQIHLIGAIVTGQQLKMVADFLLSWRRRGTFFFSPITLCRFDMQIHAHSVLRE
jgi:hypothetical protein